jgi:3-phosphoshikimate 1-carboxyvinyltransferase
MSAAQHINRVQRPFDIELTLPGSKSIALRHLVMSSLARFQTTIRGVPKCDDVNVMIRALTKLGITIDEISASTFVVDPPDSLSVGNIYLDLELSGVSLRLLLAVAALRPATTHFDGLEPLRVRPNKDMIEALEELGCSTTAINDGRLPISVTGTLNYSPEVSVGTGTSSQYLSGLLLVAPLLPHGLTVHMKDAMVSASYVDITRTEMAKRGIVVEMVGHKTLHVKAQNYNANSISIEGDASAATYHAALATIHGSTTRIHNLGKSTTQGDFGFIELCRKLGATVNVTKDAATITGPGNLRALKTVDMQLMPDAAPTLMAIAPFLPKPILITGLSTLRDKECDRIACPIHELAKAGVHIEEGEDYVTVYPVNDPKPAHFNTYDDHRMAMSLAVFASKVGGCKVLDPDCVSKTYADFWRDFERVYG